MRRWVALSTGNTLTKGLHTQPFRIHSSLRTHAEAWLNTDEKDGGRPRGPSPFLLPSAQTDNGQMSPSTLGRIFTDICKAAGFGGDPRVHPHAMRHSFAHSLARQGNSAKQISIALGHRSTQVTNDVYLRDNVERGCQGMVLPTHWNSGETTSPPEDVPVSSSINRKKNKATTNLSTNHSCASGTSAPKVSKKDLFEKMTNMMNTL